MKKTILFIFYIFLNVSGFAQPASGFTFSVPDVMPQFKGGTAELLEYINQQIIFSDEDKEKNVAGELIITFTVDKSGTLSDITIKKGISSSIDLELIRIIRAMPLWIPGRINRENVTSKFSLSLMIDAGQQKVNSVL
ncbi:MAG: energy transducer TonB [Bacteroidia bacterium]